MKKNKSTTVAPAQLLPAEPQSPCSELSQLERLVQQKVAEILANRDDLLLRPFFDTKRVSVELRRSQTMNDRQKWVRYFERHGCLICGTKDSVYVKCGMCCQCSGRTSQRLNAILDEGVRDQRRQQFNGNLESIARKVLLGTINALPPASKRAR